MILCRRAIKHLDCRIDVDQTARTITVIHMSGHEQPPGNAHLRRCKADALMLLHQLNHAVGNSPDLLIHVGHIPGSLPQDLGGVVEDAQRVRIDGHGCMVEEPTKN